MTDFDPVTQDRPHDPDFPASMMPALSIAVKNHFLTANYKSVKVWTLTAGKTCLKVSVELK